MKKKIALFLVAALLLGAGLIMSCDDAAKTNEETTTPDNKKDDSGKTAGKYTVKFDPNGGTLATGDESEIEVDAGKTGAKNWPNTPTKPSAYLHFNDIFLGWFDADGTEYTATKAINANVTLKAKWQAFVWPDPLLDFDSFHPLGACTNSNPTDTRQRGWLFGDGGDDYTFTDSTWLLLEVKGGNMYGFGGVQVTFIEDDYDDGDGKWEATVGIDWQPYNKAADEIIYYAIQLKQHTKYADFKSAVGSGSYTLYIASYPWENLGFLNAYLTDDNLQKISANKLVDLKRSTTAPTFGFIISTVEKTLTGVDNIPNGTYGGIDWDDLWSTAFVPVTAINYTGATKGFVNSPITLTATVTPGNATNTTIVWSGTGVSGSTYTPTATGTATVTATITDGTAEGTDKVVTVSITTYTKQTGVSDYTPDWDTLEVSGQSWMNSGDNKPPAVTLIEDSGDKIGYSYTWAGGANVDYDNAYPIFQVTFDTSVSLADYDTVTLKFKGIKGDLNWKDIGLYASTTKITGQINDAYLVSDKVRIKDGFEAGSTYDVTLTIDKGKALELYGHNDLYCSLFSNVAQKGPIGGTNSVTEFEITDVEFKQN